MSDFYLNGYQQPYFFVFLLGQIIGDTGSKSITMNKKTAPILVLLSIITLLSTLLYSCESNMKPAYVGTWENYDSSEVIAGKGPVRKIVYQFGESNFTFTASQKEENKTEFEDIIRISGQLNIRAEQMTVVFKALSMPIPGSTDWLNLKSPDDDFLNALDRLNLEDSTVYNFKILNSKLTLTNEDTTFVLRRQ